MSNFVLSCWLNTGNHAYLCGHCRRQHTPRGVVRVVAFGKEPQDQPCAWCGDMTCTLCGDVAIRNGLCERCDMEETVPLREHVEES